MSEDLTTGAAAGRLRLLPAVVRLYPTRPSALRSIGTAAGLVRELVMDDTITSESGLAEVSVGIDGSTSAIEVGGTCIEVLRETMDGGAARRVRIRIATVDC